MRSGDAESIEAMHIMKREAIATKAWLLRGDFDGIVKSMHTGWENKKRSAASVSNPYIKKIHDAVCRAGARAGKVSGTGGGGFMIFILGYPIE